MKNKKEKVVMVSGSFDPIHLGHLNYFKEAKILGDKLVVVIDGDAYTIRKKGKVFMPVEDRKAIIEEFDCVDEVIALPKDRTDVSEAILNVKPDFFARGGDSDSVNKFDKEERDACNKVGCKVVFGVGGYNKIRASSDLLKEWTESQKSFSKMKILIYNVDKGGFRSTEYGLSEALKKLNVNVDTSDKIEYRKYDVVQILFDYSIFHPWGLGVIPILMRLKLNGKKIVLTFGVVQPKVGIYARNKFFTTIKKMVLPITHMLLNIFVNKIVVMLPHLKEILIKDYKTNKEKIEVIYVGMD